MATDDQSPSNRPADGGAQAATLLDGIRRQERAPKPVLTPSPGFAEWLARFGGCLAFSTYHTGRLFFVSADGAGDLLALDRVVGMAMGLAMDRETLWVGNRDQIWRFANTGGGQVDGVDHDAIYLPRMGYMVGGANTHDVLTDVRFGGERFDLVFANTQYDCIATLDPHYTFRALWVPDFIPDLRALDRCHLNGIGARDGELRYASICKQSTNRLGWKEKRTETGFVVDLATGARVCSGLSMPHSPRWHDGRLWLLNSGEGDFGYVDFAAGGGEGRFVPVAPCAGFARGRSCVGDYAVVGLSKLREKAVFTDMNLMTRLPQRGVTQRCGLLVIDIRTGRLEHWLTISGSVIELYDVIHVPGVSRPWTPGFSHPNHHRWRILVSPDSPRPSFRPADGSPIYRDEPSDSPDALASWQAGSADAPR